MLPLCENLFGWLGWKSSILKTNAYWIAYSARFNRKRDARIVARCLKGRTKVIYEYEMNSLDNVYYYRGAAVEAFSLASGYLDLNSIVFKIF